MFNVRVFFYLISILFCDIILLIYTLLHTHIMLKRVVSKKKQQKPKQIEISLNESKNSNDPIDIWHGNNKCE